MNPIRLIALLIIASASGCMNVPMAERHMQTFLASTPAVGADEIRQISVTPLWIETAYAKDITSRPDGKLHIGEARLTILSWLFYARVKVLDFQKAAVQRERQVYPRDPLTSK